MTEKIIPYNHAKVYKVFNELGWENISIVLEKEFNLQNKEQLNREEYKYIKASVNDPLCLNSKITGSGLSVNEYRKIYYKEHPEQRKETLDRYYEKNKDEVKERTKQWKLENREKVNEQKKIYYQKHKEEIYKKEKEYRQNNKEQINQRKKEYRHDHKEEITQTIKCICGSEIQQCAIYRHKKSKKHIQFISQNQTTDDAQN